MRVYANRKEVRAIVNSLADMRGDGLYKRTWCDKVPGSENERYLAFRFWDPEEADRVAKALQDKLHFELGYGNTVRRTSVDSDYMMRTEGGEYVRVKVLFE